MPTETLYPCLREEAGASASGMERLFSSMLEQQRMISFIPIVGLGHQLGFGQYLPRPLQPVANELVPFHCQSSMPSRVTF